MKRFVCPSWLYIIAHITFCRKNKVCVCMRLCVYVQVCVWLCLSVCKYVWYWVGVWVWVYVCACVYVSVGVVLGQWGCNLCTLHFSGLYYRADVQPSQASTSLSGWGQMSCFSIPTLLVYLFNPSPFHQGYCLPLHSIYLYKISTFAIFFLCVN